MTIVDGLRATKLSEHFELGEFLRSDYATRHGIDMSPPSKVMANLALLCNDVLEPIRKLAGPLVITSGYRPAELNAAIGGAQNSDHIKGLAADFHAVNMQLADLAKLVRSAKIQGLEKGILEYGQWLHCSVHELGQLHSPSYLIAGLEAGKTVYREWVA